MTCLHGKTPGVRIIVAPTVLATERVNPNTCGLDNMSLSSWCDKTDKTLIDFLILIFAIYLSHFFVRDMPISARHSIILTLKEENVMSVSRYFVITKLLSAKKLDNTFYKVL